MFDWTLNQFGPDPWSENRTSNFMIGQHVIFSISYKVKIGVNLGRGLPQLVKFLLIDFLTWSIRSLSCFYKGEWGMWNAVVTRFIVKDF